MLIKNKYFNLDRRGWMLIEAQMTGDWKPTMLGETRDTEEGYLAISKKFVELTEGQNMYVDPRSAIFLDKLKLPVFEQNLTCVAMAYDRSFHHGGAGTFSADGVLGCNRQLEIHMVFDDTPKARKVLGEAQTWLNE